MPFLKSIGDPFAFMTRYSVHEYPLGTAKKLLGLIEEAPIGDIGVRIKMDPAFEKLKGSPNIEMNRGTPVILGPLESEDGSPEPQKGVWYGDEASEWLRVPEPAGFKHPLSVTLPLGKLRDRRRIAVLNQDLYYLHPQSERIVCVYAGFETDFASVPKSLAAFVQSFDVHAEAAVLHDWMYAVGETNKREEADNLFSDAMVELGVGFLTRQAMHKAVRLGGESAYGAPEEWRFTNADGTARDSIPVKPQTPYETEWSWKEIEERVKPGSTPRDRPSKPPP